MNASSIITLLMTLLATLSACAYRHDKVDPGAPAIAKEGRISEYSFEQCKEKILAPHCKECHADFMDYNTVFAKRAEIRAQVVSRRMPQNRAPLGTEDFQMLVKWLDDGALEKAGQVAPAAPPTAVLEQIPATWENLQAKFLGPYCLACHFHPDAARPDRKPKADLDLTLYSVVMEHLYDSKNEQGEVEPGIATRSLLLSQDDEHVMPTKKTQTKPSTEAKLLLMHWMTAKAPGPLPATE